MQLQLFQEALVKRRDVRIVDIGVAHAVKARQVAFDRFLFHGGFSFSSKYRNNVRTFIARSVGDDHQPAVEQRQSHEAFLTVVAAIVDEDDARSGKDLPTANSSGRQPCTRRRRAPRLKIYDLTCLPTRRTMARAESPSVLNWVPALWLTDSLDSRPRATAFRQSLFICSFFVSCLACSTASATRSAHGQQTCGERNLGLAANSTTIEFLTAILYWQIAHSTDCTAGRASRVSSRRKSRLSSFIHTAPLLMELYLFRLRPSISF